MKFINGIIALALIAIAINMTYMTYSTTHKMVSRPSNIGEERIAQVIGRVTLPFDGLGVSLGFLVKDGDNLRIIRYDKGSMADISGFEPKFVRTTMLDNGQTVFDPIIIQPFNQ